MNSPYLDTLEVAELIRKDRTKNPRLNAWRFIKKHGIPTFGDTRLLVTQASVIDTLNELAKRKLKARKAS